MIFLKNTNETVQAGVSGGSSLSLDLYAAYVDTTDTSLTPYSFESKAGAGNGSYNLLPAPAAGYVRKIKMLSVSNSGTVMTNVTISKRVAGVDYVLAPVFALLVGECVQFVDEVGWRYYAANGTVKQAIAAVGNNKALLFNDSGVTSAVDGLAYDKAAEQLQLAGANPAIRLKSVSANPAAPTEGQLLLYAKNVAGKAVAKVVGFAGLDSPLQNALWQNNTVLWTPGSAGAGSWQGTTGTSTGTAAIVLPTTINPYTTMRRSQWSNVATTLNQQVGTRTELMFMIGNSANMGGFFFAARCGLNTWTAGCRFFAGFSISGANVVTANPSTLIHILGFAVDDTDNAITFMHNDNTAGGVIKEMIANQPVLSANVGFDMYIWAKPNADKVYYRMDDVNTGATLVDSFVDGRFPGAYNLMQACVLASNGANTAANSIQIGVNRIYIETDR